jgi:hypothetical protein
MLAAVVAIEVVLWAERLRELSISHEARAIEHAWAEQTDDGRYCSLYLSLDFAGETECWLNRPADRHDHIPEEPESLGRRAYHHRMFHKWRDAAHRPWLPVPPDPPEPE